MGMSGRGSGGQGFHSRNDVSTEMALAILLVYFGMLFMSMVAHEYAHAWTATRAGDYTAWDMGRLTFNPLAHVDLFWTVVMPIGSRTMRRAM